MPSARDRIARRRFLAEQSSINVVDKAEHRRAPPPRQKLATIAPPPPETPPEPPIDAQLRSPFDLPGSPPSAARRRRRPDLVEASRPVGMPVRAPAPKTLEQRVHQLCVDGWGNVPLRRLKKFRDALATASHAIVQIVDTYGAVGAVAGWTRRATKRPVSVIDLPSIRLANVESVLASVWNGTTEDAVRSAIPVLCGFTEEYGGVVADALERNPREKVVAVTHRNPRELGRLYDRTVTTWGIQLDDGVVNQCSTLIRTELGLPVTPTAQDTDRLRSGGDPRWLLNQLRFSRIPDNGGDDDDGASQSSQLGVSRDDGGAEPVMRTNLRTLLGTDDTTDEPAWTPSLATFVHAAYPVAIGATVGRSKMSAARNAAQEGRRCPPSAGRAIAAALDAVAVEADALSTVDTAPYLSRGPLAAVEHEIVGRSTRVAIRTAGELDDRDVERKCEDAFFAQLRQLSRFKGLAPAHGRLDASYAATALGLWGCYVKLRPPRHAPTADAIAYAAVALWQEPEEPGQFAPVPGWIPVLPPRDPRHGLCARTVARWFAARCAYPHFEATTAWTLAWSALAQDVQRATSGAELLEMVVNVIAKALDRVESLRVGPPVDAPARWLDKIDTVHPQLFDGPWPSPKLRRESYNIWRAARTLSGP